MLIAALAALAGATLKCLLLRVLPPSPGAASLGDELADDGVSALVAKVLGHGSVARGVEGLTAAVQGHIAAVAIQDRSLAEAVLQRRGSGGEPADRAARASHEPGGGPRLRRRRLGSHAPPAPRRRDGRGAGRGRPPRPVLGRRQGRARPADRVRGGRATGGRRRVAPLLGALPAGGVREAGYAPGGFEGKARTEQAKLWARHHLTPAGQPSFHVCVRTDLLTRCLGHLRGLAELTLVNHDRTRGLDELQGPKALAIEGCWNLADIGAVAAMGSLERLDLVRCDGPFSARPLVDRPTLKRATLVEVEALDIEALMGITWECGFEVSSVNHHLALKKNDKLRVDFSGPAIS